MKNSIIITTLFYLLFVVLAAAGLFLIDVFVEPYILGDYVLPGKSTHAQFGTPALIAMFALPSAILTGIPFGVMLGLGIVSRPVYKAFWLGVCVVILLAAFDWYSIKTSGTIVERHQLHWGIKIAEGIVFVSVLALTSLGINRLAASLNIKVRNIISMLIPLIFFGLLFATR